MGHLFSFGLIVVLVAFGIYRRIRRTIGWQQLNLRKLWVRTILFIIVGILIFEEGVLHPISLFSDIIGIGLGGLLAYYGLTLTSFERRDDLMYYRPNTWIGSLVTLIFLFRLFYRFYLLYSSGVLNSAAHNNSEKIQTLSGAIGTSWTTGLLLIMFAYYSIYYLILIRKQKRNLAKDTL